jgi:hypothetical protein
VVPAEPIPDEAIEAAATWAVERLKPFSPPEETMRAWVRDQIRRALASDLREIGVDRIMVHFTASGKVWVREYTSTPPWQQIWPEETDHAH